MKNTARLESDFLSSIRKFIAAPQSMTVSRMFRGDRMEAYLRNGTKIINGNVVRCVTVASVEVYAKREGIYSFFLRFIEENSFGPICIENVHSVEHSGIYERRGFVGVVNHLGTVDGYFKEKTLFATPKRTKEKSTLLEKIQ